MEAIQTLMNEHRVIEKVLTALETWVTQIMRTTKEDKDELARFVIFIREYADTRHHGKEEDVLFDAMIQNGFPREQGPLAVMLHEHDQGRSYCKALDGLAQQSESWDDHDRETLANAVRGYTGLLREHIQKEDTVLYPMAEQRLPETAVADIIERCRRVDEESASRGDSARLDKLAEELIAAQT